MESQTPHQVIDRTLTAVEITPLSTDRLKQRVQQIQQIMRQLMLNRVHYGIIPGTEKPSLWRAGAELLGLTFHLSGVPEVEQIGGEGEVAYRIITKLYDASGGLVSVGVGECSSSEEKFAWREAICQEEFDGTDPTLRRVKYRRDRDSGEILTVNQIHTNPADQRNAVLKRASTRSFREAILRGTAASDIFDQQLEEDDEPRGEKKLKEQPQQQAKAGAMLDGIFKSANPADPKTKKPGQIIIESGAGMSTYRHVLGFWDTPADLVKELTWSKLVNRPCRFSFEAKESKGKIYRNLTFLQFLLPAEDKAGDLFGSDRAADEERAAMQGEA